MHTLLKVVLSAGVVLGLATLALAQRGPTPDAATRATLSDPEGPPPNPANVPFVLPKDIKWTGDAARQQTAVLYGDQSKEGPYGVLIKWAPGAYLSTALSRSDALDLRGLGDVVGQLQQRLRRTHDVSVSRWHFLHRCCQHRALGRCAYRARSAGNHSAHRRRAGEDGPGRRERKAAAASRPGKSVGRPRQRHRSDMRKLARS